MHKSIIRKYIPSFSFSHLNEDIPNQLSLCDQFFDTSEENLLADLQENHKALVSVYLGYKHAFLNSVSNCYLKWYESLRNFDGISFSKNAFNESIRSRIFCSKFNLNTICPCRITLEPTDLSKRDNIFHCLSCKNASGGTIERHNSVRNLLMSFINRFIPFAITQPEYLYICPVNNLCSKKVDLFVKIPGDSFSGDISFFIDVNIFNLGCHSNSITSLSELVDKHKLHETRKSSEYKKVSLSDDPRFVPFIVDTTGNIGPKALSFLRRLGDYSKDYSGRSVGNKAAKKFASLFIQCMQYKLLESLYLQREIHQNSIASSILHIVI